MDELFKKLLEAEILTEDTKKELESAFAAKLQEAEKQARDQAVLTVTEELNQQWIDERNTLIEALDAKITEVMEEEFKELHTDIQSFRDLEVEYAQKIVEAKQEMADQLKVDIGELLEKLDTFLEIRLASELEELRESIDEAREKKFGQTVFEAFKEEFKQFYASDDSVEGRLNETEQRLNDTQAQLLEAESQIAKLQREAKLKETLAPLSGRTREVMEAILQKVDTSMIEDAYKHYIGRVLKESDKTSEKETTVLAEDSKGGKQDIRGVNVNGDNVQQLQESKQIDAAHEPKLSDDTRRTLLKLAGVVGN